MSATMLASLVAYQRAAEACDALVAEVSAEQWEARTPCSEWNVRQLVNHLATENRWIAPLLAGRTVSDVGNSLDGDLLGAYPASAWANARLDADAAAAATSPNAVVHVRSGDISAEDYLWQIAADHLVHSWDLAVTLGVDRGFEPDLVESVANWFASQELACRDAGMIGPRVEVAPGADAQVRLLAMFGRVVPKPDTFAVVDRFGAAFDAADVDAVMATMTTDCVFESTAPPDGERHVGQHEVRAAWTKFFAESAGATFTTESRFACGDRAVVHWRYDWTGADPGHVRGVDIFRVRDGLVAEKVSYVKG